MNKWKRLLKKKRRKTFRRRRGLALLLAQKLGYYLEQDHDSECSHSLAVLFHLYQSISDEKPILMAHLPTIEKYLEQLNKLKAFL
jgi:D-hexose-6-phosphate mutarotase